MPAQISISYRRNDAGGHAGRLCDRLVHWLDAESLFYDQGNIDSGEHFPCVLDDELAGARALQEQALAVCRRVLGEAHPTTSISAWNLFATLQQAEDSEAASTVLREHLLWLAEGPQ